MNKKTVISKRGFTLIEILVVVAIIGILAGVVLVGLRGTGPQARNARRVADLRQVQNGLELYFNKCGYYPGPAACAGVAWSSVDYAGLKTSLIDAGIGVKNIPQDPQNTAPQQYFYSSTDGKSYVLGVALEDPATSKLLDGDIDGTVESKDCGAAAGADTIYCVQL